MLAVYKKELKSYLTSMIGYVFIAFILLILGIYFTAYNLQYASPDFGYTLNAVTFLFLIITPVLTMRILSEEKKNKTDQLLLTAPVTVWKIVMGKYLSMITIYSDTGSDRRPLSFYPGKIWNGFLCHHLHGGFWIFSFRLRADRGGTFFIFCYRKPDHCGSDYFRCIILQLCDGRNIKFLFQHFHGILYCFSGHLSDHCPCGISDDKGYDPFLGFRGCFNYSKCSSLYCQVLPI